MIHQETIHIKTGGRGTINITSLVNSISEKAGIRNGICHLFIQHTSASLILCENADPVVRNDLDHFLEKLVPDGDPEYQHDTEGPDDMAAHIRSILTNSSLTIPVSSGRVALGIWQGIYLYEHRTSGHNRSILITVYGE